MKSLSLAPVLLALSAAALVFLYAIPVRSFF